MVHFGERVLLLLPKLLLNAHLLLQVLENHLLVLEVILEFGDLRDVVALFQISSHLLDLLCQLLILLVVCVYLLVFFL